MKIEIKSDYDIWKPIELDANEYDDVMHLRRFMKSSDMVFALSEIVWNMQKKIRWEIEGREESGEPMDAYDVLYRVFDRIQEELDEHGINIDDLVR